MENLIKDFINNNKNCFVYTYSNYIYEMLKDTDANFDTLSYYIDNKDVKLNDVACKYIATRIPMCSILIFYLYDIWEQDCVISNEFMNDILYLVDYLKANKYRIIVLTEKHIYQYNMEYGVKNARKEKD